MGEPPKFRVLWICGAPGAGKSVAAWSLFERLTASGAVVAYVDIDQLGMLYPETAEDPFRFALKSAALDALIPGYVAAGVHALLVSGVVDPTARPVLETDVELTLCLLSPGAAVLRDRLLDRGWEKTDLDDAELENTSLREGGFVDLIVDTDGLSIEETAARLEHLVDRNPRPDALPRAGAAAPSLVEVVVIAGPRAVGTSTVGFGLAMRAWRAGRRVGFVDLQQLGFRSGRDGRTGNDTTLAIGQLTAMHRLFSGRGAQRLVVAAHLAAQHQSALKAAFGSSPTTIVRLRGDGKALRDHVLERVSGEGVRLAGDDLVDASESYQAIVVERALIEQADLEDHAIGDMVIDVTGRAAADVIDGIEAAPPGVARATGYRSAMSENTNENKDESMGSGLGISDDQLPDDLVPSEDNPLAEGLPAGETAETATTEVKGGADGPAAQQPDNAPEVTEDDSSSDDGDNGGDGEGDA